MVRIKQEDKPTQAPQTRLSDVARSRDGGNVGCRKPWLVMGRLRFNFSQGSMGPADSKWQGPDL
jgi:hypothetical protein